VTLEAERYRFASFGENIPVDLIGVGLRYRFR
jgi:hypothetical protein